MLCHAFALYFLQSSNISNLENIIHHSWLTFRSFVKLIAADYCRHESAQTTQLIIGRPSEQGFEDFWTLTRWNNVTQDFQ